MKHIYILMLLSLLSLNTSCTLKAVVNQQKYYEQLVTIDDVKVLSEIEAMKIPENSIVVGTVRLKDRGFTTKCSYFDGIELLKEIARKQGANLVFINTHEKPSVWGSNCHRFSATLYRTSQQTKL